MKNKMRKGFINACITRQRAWVRVNPVRAAAFTLAEALTVIGVIGVVAALTIPTLITNIKNNVEARQREVITTRFIDGLNIFNTMENGLSQKYETTYDFLKSLSAHYKMTSICDEDHLNDCLPYSLLNTSEGSVEVNSNLKSSLIFPENFLPPAGFISANGTPFIVAFSSNCTNLDPDSADPDKKMDTKNGAITPCIAGFYDLNGTRNPNKISQDVMAFNGANISINNKPTCLFENEDLCVISFYPEPGFLTESESKAYLGTDKGYFFGSSFGKELKDYWAWGKQKCEKDGGHIPSEDELYNLLSSAYGVNKNINLKQSLRSSHNVCVADTENPYGKNEGCTIIDGFRLDQENDAVKAGILSKPLVNNNIDGELWQYSLILVSSDYMYETAIERDYPDAAVVCLSD